MNNGNKMYQYETENRVQRPGKLQKLTMVSLIALDSFLILFTIMGVSMGEREMTLVFGGLAFFFLVIILFLKRAYNTSYLENNEYFILRVRNEEYQVFYDDIIDWKPSFNEIAIVDRAKPNQKYIRVNIRFFRPEILLRTVADMAFEGKFDNMNQTDQFESKKINTVYYLVDNHYGYLVEDYVAMIENNKPN